MKTALGLILMTCIGCGVDQSADPADPGEGTGPVTEVSGHVGTSTWMGTIHVVSSVTIDKGATVTVMPGTTVDFTSNVQPGVGINVLGTLDVRGTKADKVVFRPSTSGQFWYGITLPGGTMTATYLVQLGGQVGIDSTGSVTLSDTQMSHANGDLITMTGGTLNMTYSAIGVDVGQRDTTHCDMHVSGPVTITVSHSNFSTSSYGIMLYGGHADFTSTNWFGNTVADVATVPSDPVTGSFRDSYFAKAAPSDPRVPVYNLATTRIADAGVR